MGSCHIIALGKLKGRDAFLPLQQEYLKRINSPIVHLHEIKAHSNSQEKEEKDILQLIQNITLGKTYRLILLDESGKLHHSKSFSNFMEKEFERTEPYSFFILGGAYGFRKELKEKASYLLSLSPLTLPHKLARVFFLEQIYRAQTLREGHPYHND